MFDLTQQVKKLQVKKVVIPAAALPQTAQAAIATIAGGRVKVLSIVSEVTTVIETQANDTKLIANPTVGADVDLCAALDITAQAVGTNNVITGTVANAMVANASAVSKYQASPLIIPEGTIDLDCAASNTGAMSHVIEYMPLDEGATIVAA